MHLHQGCGHSQVPRTSERHGDRMPISASPSAAFATISSGHSISSAKSSAQATADAATTAAAVCADCGSTCTPAPRIAVSVSAATTAHLTTTSRAVALIPASLLPHATIPTDATVSAAQGSAVAIAVPTAARHPTAARISSIHPTAEQAAAANAATKPSAAEPTVRASCPSTSSRAATASQFTDSPIHSALAAAAPFAIAQPPTSFSSARSACESAAPATPGPSLRTPFAPDAATFARRIALGVCDIQGV
mmetsp:Transcript_6031/g.18922  ORF Transcript_6031/g.18922 Transcript_6031/m.18922 type:complete len:250 (-) Transcript_6031:1185-1934(-)